MKFVLLPGKVLILLLIEFEAMKQIQKVFILSTVVMYSVYKLFVYITFFYITNVLSWSYHLFMHAMQGFSCTVSASEFSSYVDVPGSCW